MTSNTAVHLYPSLQYSASYSPVFCLSFKYSNNVTSPSVTDLFFFLFLSSEKSPCLSIYYPSKTSTAAAAASIIVSSLGPWFPRGILGTLGIYEGVISYLGCTCMSFSITVTLWPCVWAAGWTFLSLQHDSQATWNDRTERGTRIQRWGGEVEEESHCREMLAH